MTTEPNVGQIAWFAGPIVIEPLVPQGWLLCDGSPFDVHARQNQALLAVIGRRYGTQGEWPLLPKIASPAPGVNVFICRDGVAPPVHDQLWIPDTMGFIVPITAATPPASFLFCDGQTLSIESNTTLFAIVGNPVGPDPDNATQFTLPDLRSLGSYAICAEGFFPAWS